MLEEQGEGKLNAIDEESGDDEEGLTTPSLHSRGNTADLNRTRPPLISEEDLLAELSSIHEEQHDEEKAAEKTLEEFMKNADQTKLLEFIKNNGTLLAEILKSLPPEQKKKNEQTAEQVLAGLQDEKTLAALLQVMVENEGIAEQLKALLPNEEVMSEESESEEEQEEEIEYSTLEIGSEGLSDHEKSAVSAPWRFKHFAAIITTLLVATAGGIAAEHHFEITKKIMNLFKKKRDTAGSSENETVQHIHNNSDVM